MIRNNRKRVPFAQIPHTVLEDTDLKPKTLGLLVYMLSKPHHWAVHATQLANRFGVNPKTVHGLLNELIDLGYVKREQAREKGRVVGVIYDVFDEKQGHDTVTQKTVHQKTVCGKAGRIVKRTLSNIDIDSERLMDDSPSATVRQSKTRSSKIDYSPEFEQLWQMYPKRVGGNPKRDAFQAYNARLAEGTDYQDILAGLERYAGFCRQKYNGQPSEYIMQAKRFFGPARGFDEPWHFQAEPQKPPKPGSIAAMYDLHFQDEPQPAGEKEINPFDDKSLIGYDEELGI